MNVSVNKACIELFSFAESGAGMQHKLVYEHDVIPCAIARIGLKACLMTFVALIWVSDARAERVSHSYPEVGITLGGILFPSVGYWWGDYHRIGLVHRNCHCVGGIEEGGMIPLIIYGRQPWLIIMEVPIL
ncbi:MAG: hypothetical protein ACX931_13780 [Saccharospirillum sp.]